MFDCRGMSVEPTTRSFPLIVSMLAVACWKVLPYPRSEAARCVASRYGRGARPIDLRVGWFVPRSSGSAEVGRRPTTCGIPWLSRGCPLDYRTPNGYTYLLGGVDMREAILAILSKEPSHGYELHQRLAAAMGESDVALNVGQVYVTLSRLERAGLVLVRDVGQGSRPDKKVYEATARGREVVREWLADTSWRKIAPVDFHLKLVAAATTGLADPVTLVDAQRRELLRRLGQVQRVIASQPPTGNAAVLAEGAALRLQADIRWLEVCERRWTQGESE